MSRVRAVALVLAAALFALPAAAQVKDHRKLKYPPLQPFAIPEPSVLKLSNGMTVLMLRDAELPLVRVAAMIRTGTAYEPADKAGLAALTATVQRTGGAASRSGDEIDDFLAVRAATVETGMDDTAGSAVMECLSADFDDVLAVFADVLRRPLFAEDKLELAKVQARSAIARRNDSVGAITGREIVRLVYGADSPLGRRPEYATIAAITRDDLVAWHGRFFHPNNVLLGVLGDFDPDTLQQKIERAFGDWEPGPAFEPGAPVYRREPAPGLYLIEKDDVNQANIAFAHLGIDYKNPDYFAATVMNEVLGGGFSARMFSNVRSKKGLAYSVSARLGAEYLYPGLFRAGLSTKASTMSAGIDAVLAEIRGIVDDPPSDDELRRAKESLLNSFVFNFATKRQILAQQMAYRYYGMPPDTLERYRASVEKVTREDVARVARQYVHPGQLAILVVGNPAAFDKPLSSLGPVTAIDITIPPPPDRIPAAERTDGAVSRGAAVWRRVVGALAGGDPGRIEALLTRGTVRLTGKGVPVTIERETLVAFPSRWREQSSTAVGRQLVVIDGDAGFLSVGGRTVPLAAERLERQQRQQRFQLVNLLRATTSPGFAVAWTGEAEVEGTPCDVLSVELDGTVSRLWVAADGTVLKQAYQGFHPLTQAPGPVEVRYGDYRTSGALRLPYEAAMSFDGQRVMELTIDALEVNPPVAPSLFVRPAA